MKLDLPPYVIWLELSKEPAPWARRIAFGPGSAPPFGMIT